MANYIRLGSGPRKVLVLHGWFGDENTFAPMSDSFSLDEFTYVFMAYRGYGASRDIKGDFTISEISADARALASELGWTRYSLIGHSMGGMAIQRVLADEPGAVEKIIAVTPVPASGVPFDEPTWKLFSGAAGSDLNRRMIVDFSTGNRLSSSWIDHIVRCSRSTSTEAAFGAYLHSWVKTDFHQEIVGNPVPIKVIVGANDPSLTADVMRATYLAWYPNAELQVIENAGHYPMNETPVVLATSIETFLRS